MVCFFMILCVFDVFVFCLIHFMRQAMSCFYKFSRINFPNAILEISVPMFRDLVKHSPMCSEDPDDWPENSDIPPGRVRVNLKRLIDAVHAAEADEKKEGLAKNLQLTGVVFHESRCGSTLVANSLIGMNPSKHRVYSESSPPIQALGVCGENYGRCSLDQAAQIVKDVMYLMGRTDNHDETRYFFKIQSAGTRNLDVFRKAFPETPWLFVYRDPVQVMMSHFAQGEKSATCLQSKRHPHHFLQDLAERKGYDRSLSEFKPVKFCAAHLATLTENALSHIQESNGLGRPVNYITLPAILYETILPSWGVEVSPEEIDNIKTVSGTYSKARKGHAEWKEDSELKEHAATPDVQEAAKEFMQESYDKLEELAKATSTS